MDFAIENLQELDDAAVAGGLSEIHEAHFARQALGCETTGLAYYVFKPGMRQPFGHHHELDEEVYVVLSGSGRVRLGDEVIGVKPYDAVRVAPSVTRAFEAGDDGLELLAFGGHHEGDAQLVQDFWVD
jgi:mannose-6-phosphate isomerase-like protein (cupin superfamily)